MHKIMFKIDLAKLRKDRIQVRAYTNKDSEEVQVREYSLEFVPFADEKQKILKSGDTYDLVKVGFIAEATTKEEREGGYKGAILGDALYFRGKPQPEYEASQASAEEEYIQMGQ